ncbi:unnamed protein product [Bursaphelenchus xylophilus]|uniref:(pine wood nematode) hypothetical protein n=1 Tax=Bursaphelenchus xylophilus TaxID=6326 RepID=A0A1I7S3F3_BURXY|nr:unnamed protein product [Bursaphelenchus xylophilus]CAG9116269.1 unnamed protein product [Bursaphelenchus xylophilus]
MRVVIFVLLFVLPPFIECVGLARGLYCGLETCYDVLGIEREKFDKPSLSKIYRNLARKYHPDRIRGDAAEKELAIEKFRQIATAYETLKDEETKQYYDYYLDHPEERYYNYYQYYRMKTPKVDVRLVIAGTVLLISFIQYTSARQKYSEALSYAKEQVKFRNMALDVAKERKLLEFDKSGKIKKKQPNGADPDKILGSIIEENISISGGYKKATVKNTLLFYILMLPYTTIVYGVWWSKWVTKYWINKEEYDEEAKLYLIRKNLGITVDHFNGLEDHLIQDYLDKEIWKKEEFQKWKAIKEEEEKEEMAKSARYRQYRRYMKKQAGQTISFLDE